MDKSMRNIVTKEMEAIRGHGFKQLRGVSLEIPNGKDSCVCCCVNKASVSFYFGQNLIRFCPTCLDKLKALLEGLEVDTTETDT